MNAMDTWVDCDDGLLNGMKDHGLPPAPPDFGDNLETKPILEDIDSYLNKNSALITSKEKAEESIGSANLPNKIIVKKELSSPVKSLDNGHANSKVPVNNGVTNSVVTKSEPKYPSTTMVFTPFIVAPGIMGFDASVQPTMKPVKRGRPRIHPIKPDTGIKRKPGRPRIHPIKPSDGIKRKPGRPRIHPEKQGEEGSPRKPAISPVVRHIRPKPDLSLMTFTGVVPQLPHTFIPTAAMNSIQIPTPQPRPRPPPVRFVTPLAAIDPITGKRKRGRPRIHPVKIHDGIKRKPGRPKKVPTLPTNNEVVKMAPQPVFKQETKTVEKQLTPSVRSAELVEKVDFVENKDRRFSIEAEVPDTECKPFMCVACGDCFCTSEELMSHVVKHEEETDEIQNEMENSNHLPMDDVKNESIDNWTIFSRDTKSNSSLNYVEHMRKLAKFSRDTAMYSVNTQQHEQQGNTSRKEVATYS